jgi:hypothetical protein
MSGGAGTFVKLDRAMLDWQWFGDSNTVHVLIYLLMEVNWQPKQWQGMTIEPGSKVTSRAKIAAATGLTEKQVRLALDRLEKCNTITRTGAGLGQLVSIVNWAKYQYKPEEEGRTRADEKAGAGPDKGRSSGREKAAIKEGQEGNNPKNGKNSSQLPLPGITEKAPSAFGDPSINELMAFLKAENGNLMDGSVKNNRYACATLIKKARAAKPDADPVAGIKHLIREGKKVHFHGPKITSFTYLLDHTTEIANLIRSGNNGNGKQQSPEDKREAVRRAVLEQQGG